MFMFVTGSFYLPPFSNITVLKHSLGLIFIFGPGGVSTYIYECLLAVFLPHSV